MQKRTLIGVIIIVVILAAGFGGIYFIKKQFTLDGRPGDQVNNNATKINQEIIINGVSIIPIEVAQDSRCPSGVQCIWAGTVKLTVDLNVTGGANEQVLKTDLTLGEKYLYRGKDITLTKVLPIKENKQTLPEEYSFEFSVIKN